MFSLGFSLRVNPRSLRLLLSAFHASAV